MLYREINFDDYRCRNIFVRLLQNKIPGTKVYHKSHTTYQKIYVKLPDLPDIEEQLAEVKQEYTQRRKAFLAKIGAFLEKMIEHKHVEEGDLSGEEYIKINFPSPYSFIFLRAVLKTKGIELKCHPTSSTAIVGVKDEDTFNDEFWKGKLKPMVERLEAKISYLSQPYMEERDD